MPDYTQILYDIEVHSVAGIRRYFEEGGDPNSVMDNGMPLFKMMVEMYTRHHDLKIVYKLLLMPD
jgi:hypothetical protein